MNITERTSHLNFDSSDYEEDIDNIERDVEQDIQDNQENDQVQEEQEQPTSKKLSFMKFLARSVLFGGVGYLVTRLVTKIDPKIGAIASVTAITHIAIASRIKSKIGKVFLYISAFFTPIAIGAAVNIPITFKASAISIGLTFSATFLSFVAISILANVILKIRNR